MVSACQTLSFMLERGAKGSQSVSQLVEQPNTLATKSITYKGKGQLCNWTAMYDGKEVSIRAAATGG